MELLFAGVLLMATAIRIPSWDTAPPLRPAAEPEPVAQPVAVLSELDTTPRSGAAYCRNIAMTRAVAPSTEIKAAISLATDRGILQSGC